MTYERHDTAIGDLLPEGYTALDFAVAVKCLDEDGELHLITTRSKELTAWEARGMLACALDDVVRKINTHEGEDPD